jgi:hypothetical protein
VVLSPGQALFTGAGTLHSYLGGVAVELQANSDNVLRGGLTQKHVDLTELRRIMKTEAEYPEILDGISIPPFTTVFETEAHEFRLLRLDLDDSHEELVSNPHRRVASGRAAASSADDLDEDSASDDGLTEDSDFGDGHPTDDHRDELDPEQEPDWDEDADLDDEDNDDDDDDDDDQDSGGEAAAIEDLDPEMVPLSYFSPEERFVEILLCTEGEVRFESAEKSLTLKQGQSALVTATAPDYRLQGVGQLFIATVPEPQNVPLAPWEIEEKKLLAAQREAERRAADENWDGSDPEEPDGDSNETDPDLTDVDESEPTAERDQD